MLVVSNPVDVLTYLATQQLGLPRGQVLGLGTVLDTARFRSLIAERLGLPATQVSATILGEHGDSMVPLWSAAQAAGLPLDKFPGWTSTLGEDPIQTDSRQWGRSNQGQRRCGFRCRALDPERRGLDRARSKRILPVSRWSTDATESATSASRFRLSSAA